MGRRIAVSAVLGAALCVSFATLAADPSALPSGRRAAASEWAADGFEPVRVKGLELAYVRPGASLAGYRAVLVPPITVTFRRDWNNAIGSTFRMRDDDAARIKGHFADLVRDELTLALAEAGYAIAAHPGPGVLEIDAAITDLHVAAPDVRRAGRVDVYAYSAGEMTLVAELNDAATRAPVMRVYDRTRALDTLRPHRITLVESDQQARIAARAWARALLGELGRPAGATR